MNKLEKAINLLNEIKQLDKELKHLKYFLDYAVENNVDDRMTISLPAIKTIDDLKSYTYPQGSVDHNMSSVGVGYNMEEMEEQLKNIQRVIKSQVKQLHDIKFNEFKLCTVEIILSVNAVYNYRKTKRQNLYKEFKQLEINLSE
jgi:hypothetical protein